MFLVADVALFIVLMKWPYPKLLQPVHSDGVVVVTLYDYVHVHSLCTNTPEV